MTRQAAAARITDALLDAQPWQADPLADDTIARILAPQSAGSDPSGAPWERIACVNQLFATWTDNASLAGWQAPAGTPPDIAQALQSYLQAGHALPSWADAERVERAEALFMDHGALSCVLLFCSSLPECYVIPDLASVLHVAGELEQHTEHRIRSTAAMIFPVMMHGGLTRADGAGVAQVLKVRLIHATIRHLILRGAPVPGRPVGEVPPLERPADASLYQTLYTHGWHVGRDGLPCNQAELAYTLLTFGYVFLRSLRRLGLAFTAADEEAYLHAWNVVGHVLGIDNSLMAHTMDEAADLLERLQARGRAQVTQPDARPALAAALMTTMEQAIPWRIARPFPRLMTRYLCGRATSAELALNRQRAPWPSWLLFWALLGACRLVDTVARWVWPQFSLSRSFTRVLGYHLLVKMLMDQTRPLKLPAQVLHQLGRCVAGWSDDPRAPRWLNRLEDRLTTTGSWLSAGTHGTGGAPAAASGMPR
ncbi:oxygenase MpaB family protein [Acidovorax sp. FG27]|uniref:oxygenase MpaB family protein n=1 Tax=Acidovorax sp. FG27 TaxID=3133652 RepID=UPI0030EA63D2